MAWTNRTQRAFTEKHRPDVIQEVMREMLLTAKSSECDPVVGSTGLLQSNIVVILYFQERYLKVRTW